MGETHDNKNLLKAPDSRIKSKTEQNIHEQTTVRSAANFRISTCFELAPEHVNYGKEHRQAHHAEVTGTGLKSVLTPPHSVAKTSSHA